MQTAKRRDTKPERDLRTIMHRAGLRYRVDYPLPLARRRGDVVFPKQAVAVFVDGCFWHGCPEHASWPRNNGAWWRAKIEANRARDRDTDRLLGEAGWTVVRVWEHEDPTSATQRVIEALDHARDL